MASHASDDEEADLLTFDLGGFISDKAKEQEARYVGPSAGWLASA